MLRGFSGLPKISRDGLDISEGCAGSADGGAGSAAGAEPAAGVVPIGGAGSGDAISLGVRSSGGIRGVKMAFESFEEVSEEKGIILIIFSISSSKFSRINLFNNIINNFEFFIIIIIFFNNSSSSFKSKKINLLKIIFFFDYTFLNYKN